HRRFHRINVRVKGAGLHVRSRTGFLGVADEEMAPGPSDPVQRMLVALSSPFASGALSLKLTSLFGHDLQKGSFMRSLLQINPKELTFQDAPDGSKKASFDVIAMTFGDNGRVIDQSGRTYNISIAPDKLKNALNKGLVYTINVPVKKPGAYQLRIAVRDVG